jgi:hypothetical protein
VNYKKGGYTPKYEKRARIASEMSRILEIHFSIQLNVGGLSSCSDSPA